MEPSHMHKDGRTVLSVVVIVLTVGVASRLEASANDCSEAGRYFQEAVQVGAARMNLARADQQFRRCLSSPWAGPQDTYRYARFLFETLRYDDALDQLSIATEDLEREGVACPSVVGENMPGGRTDSDRTLSEQVLLLEVMTQVVSGEYDDYKEGFDQLERSQRCFKMSKAYPSLLESELTRADMYRRSGQDDLAISVLTEVVTGRVVSKNDKSLVPRDFMANPPSWARGTVARAFRELSRVRVGLPTPWVCRGRGVTMDSLACIQRAVALVKQGGVDAATARYVYDLYHSSILKLKNPQPAVYGESLRYWKRSLKEGLKLREIVSPNGVVDDRIANAGLKLAKAVLVRSPEKEPILFRELELAGERDAVEKAVEWLQAARSNKPGRERYRILMLARGLLELAWMSGEPEEHVLEEISGYLSTFPRMEEEPPDTAVTSGRTDPQFLALAEMCRARYNHLMFRLETEELPLTKNSQYRKNALASYLKVLDLFDNEKDDYLKSGWLASLRDEAVRFRNRLERM